MAHNELKVGTGLVGAPHPTTGDARTVGHKEPSRIGIGPSVVSWKYAALRFDQMVMIVRLDGWADTERICPDGRARERAIWSNPKGGPKWGARSAAKPG